MSELRYQHLRRRFCAEGWTVRSLAAEMGMPLNDLAAKLSGCVPFDLDEVYDMADLLRVPYEDIPWLWPRGGIDADAPRRRRREATDEDELGRKLLQAICSVVDETYRR